MCSNLDLFLNSKININVYACVITIFFVTSLIYWLLFIPLIYTHLHQSYEFDTCVIFFWIIVFILWCPIMLSTLFIIHYLKKYTTPNNAEYPLSKTDEYLKNMDLKDHVKKRLGITEPINSSKSETGSVKKQNEKPGLLKRLSTKIKKEEINTTQPEIIALPEFNPHQSIFHLTSLNKNELHANEPAEVFRTESPIPFDEHLHIVQVESPSTPKPLKSPREIFFQDLIENFGKSNNDTNYFDFEESDNLRDDKMGDRVFIGTVGRQDSVTSEIFIPIDENGVIADEPIELGKYKVLKEK